MKWKQNVPAVIIFSILTLFQVNVCLAQDSATPQEVYDLILKALPVVEELGEEGLKAFNDPKGEFAYKDTYVAVINCKTMQMAAHPNNKLIGVDLGTFEDKNPDPAKRIKPNAAMCTAGKQPNGGWTDFYWVKLGDDKPVRKINFSLAVPGTDYILIAGIYDETTSIETLNTQLK